MIEKIGTFSLPTHDAAVDGSAADVFSRIREQTVHAETLGFHGAWFAEHHFQAHGGVLSAPAVLMAALAQHTSRIRLGFGVIQLPFHHPLSVAEQVATLDHLCGGRLDVGVGRGFLKTEYDGFGIPMSESRERFTEAVELLRKALCSEKFSFDSRHYRVNDICLTPAPVQSPPPLWVAAALSPESFVWAGQQGLGLMVAPMLSPQLGELRERIELYRKARCEAALPGPGEIALTVHVHVAESQAQAEDESREHLLRYVRETKQAGSSAIAAFHRDGIPADFARYPALGRHWATFRFEQAVADGLALIGTPAHCRDKLAALAEQLGGTYLLGFFDFGQKRESVLRSMSLFREKVVS